MEPERKIEKWLRAFAKKRREQAGEPMPLRPAMRERLQREVSRQFEEKSRGGFFANLFFGPRLKLTFAACFAALTIGGWVLLRESSGPPPAQLSMNKIPEPEIPPATAAPVATELTPPAVTSPAIATADEKVLEERQKAVPAAPQPTAPVVASANRSLSTLSSEVTTKRDRTENAAAPTPAGNTQLAFKNEAAADSFAAKSVDKDASGALPAAVAPPTSNLIAGTIDGNANAQTFQNSLALQRPAAAPGSSNAAFFDTAKSTGAVTVSQIFNRLEAPATRRIAAKALKSPATILTSFRVEQNGNSMKIIDADGSVYTGSVQIAQQEPTASYSFAPAKSAPVGTSQLAKASAPTPQSYFFRVAGTNRDLNENIVFSGNFVPFTNHQLAANAGGAGGEVEVRDQSVSRPIQAVLSDSKIEGHIVIGDQKAIDVIANPAR